MTDARRCILFDFNGVLVDDEDLHFETLRDTLAEAGLALDRATYDAEYLGFDDRGCFLHAFRARGGEPGPGEVAAAIEAKAARYASRIGRELRMIPGAVGFVRAAAGDHRLGIVSGAIRREIDLVLEAADIRSCFEAVVAAEDVEACKPDPAGYRRGLDLLAADPARTVVVEDSLPGLAAARALGLRCAMLSTSHSADLLGGADTVWPSFEGRHPSELPFAGR